MSRHKLDLVTREAFAALSLHEKNAYIRRVVADIQGLRGDELHPAGSAGLVDVERELRAWMAAGLVAVRFMAPRPWWPRARERPSACSRPS